MKRYESIQPDDDTDLDNDLVQIKTSPGSKELMANHEFKNHFDDDMEMIKFAVSIAIKNGLEPVASDGSFKTSHNYANFDRDNRMAGLLTVFKKSNTPARLVTQLAEAGFRYIKTQFDKGDSFRDLV